MCANLLLVKRTLLSYSCLGSKHFNFVPKTFMIPAEYSEFAATHHRMRGECSFYIFAVC